MPGNGRNGWLRGWWLGRCLSQEAPVPKRCLAQLMQLLQVLRSFQAAIAFGNVPPPLLGDLTIQDGNDAVIREVELVQEVLKFPLRDREIAMAVMLEVKLDVLLSPCSRRHVRANPRDSLPRLDLIRPVHALNVCLVVFLWLGRVRVGPGTVALPWRGRLGHHLSITLDVHERAP